MSEKKSMLPSNEIKSIVEEEGLKEGFDTEHSHCAIVNLLNIETIRDVPPDITRKKIRALLRAGAIMQLLQAGHWGEAVELKKNPAANF